MKTKLFQRVRNIVKTLIKSLKEEIKGINSPNEFSKARRDFLKKIVFSIGIFAGINQDNNFSYLKLLKSIKNCEFYEIKINKTVTLHYIYSENVESLEIVGNYFKTQKISVVFLKESLPDIVFENEDDNTILIFYFSAIIAILGIYGIFGDEYTPPEVSIIVLALEILCMCGLFYTLIKRDSEYSDVDKFLNEVSSLNNLTIVSNIHPNKFIRILKHLGLKVKMVDKTDQFMNETRRQVINLLV